MQSVAAPEVQDESTPIPQGMRYEHGRVVPRLDVEERRARGKAARSEVPRGDHAAYAPRASRPDPVELLEQQSVSRVQELVPIRYGRMLVSPFTFYRGAARIMAADLADTPQSGITTQVCGDAHLLNFGAFASPERRLDFGLNDFDETLPGPWEWDVKRLAVSFAIAGRENGYAVKDRRKVVLSLVAAYRTAMHQLAAMTNLGVWYTHLEVEAVLQQLRTEIKPGARKRVEANVARARTHDSMQALAKLTQIVDGKRRIISNPPLIEPIEDILEPADQVALVNTMYTMVHGYRRSLPSDRRHLVDDFTLGQVARKVVGVGSVGTRAWILLMEARDGIQPLFLQAKEAQASVLADYCAPSEYANQGERVVAGQHLMQAQSDIFLGWTRVLGPDGVERDFYLRQLRDWKFSMPIEQMLPSGMRVYAGLCGWTLARAHACSGDRIALAAYLGGSSKFDEAIADFAETYADQNERDYAALQTAVKEGRAEASTEI